MKPRFSIRMLLGVTAYAAICIAGLVKPLSWWSDIAFVAWFFTMIWLAAIAAGRTSSASVFSRAFILSALAYIGVSWIRSEYYTRGGVATWRVPHEALWIAVNPDITNDPADPDGNLWFSQGMLLARLIHVYTASIFGLLGGGLALWRYRRLERRKQHGT